MEQDNPQTPLTRIDLHVHSRFSKRTSQWVLKKIGCPESFTEPRQVYDTAIKKGMDMVTITDHNTISGALEIAHLPGTFVSEEITTYFPENGCKVHVLAYDISEAQHLDIQKVRENIFDLTGYLDRENIYHVLAHPLYSVNDRLTLEHFEKLVLLFKTFELNNHQLKAGGFKLSAESTDTGRKTRLSFFHFYSFIGTWLKMVLKIAFYHFVGNLPRCCTKIPPRPKMPPPISLFKVGKFFQQFRRRPTLYPSHYLTWCQIRRRRDEHMHMILTHNSTYDIDLKCLTSLTNKLFDSKCHFTLQYFITIFCYPYKMILNIENRMTSISIFHKPSYSRVDSNINPMINLSA